MTKKLVIECEDFDTTEIYLALKVHDYKLVLSDFDQWLRQKIKYEDVTTMDLQEVRARLNEMARDYEVEI